MIKQNFLIVTIIFSFFSITEYIGKIVPNHALSDQAALYHINSDTCKPKRSFTGRKRLLSPNKTEVGHIVYLDEAFKGWLKKTKDVPPDFDTMPSNPFLPNPMIIDEDGKNIPIKTISQWQQKRRWIKKEYQYWISGSRPPAPKTFHSKVLSSTTLKDGVELRDVELTFGPENKAKMDVELMIPPGNKKFPVFMTQGYQRGWAQVAVTRGYIGCVYAGADSDDDTKNYREIYPKYDFAKLMRRAWGCSRVIDYLYTLPEVDTNEIALAGHSRNGKQSLMAAAFDNRIKAVVSSSGGTGGENTFRWSDDRFTPGSFDQMISNQPHWFSPRLTWFIGREQKLPVDQNSLMSLIAPRGLMMVSAITEHEGNPWGIEQSYKSVKTIYHFLHADSKIAILLRRGRHQHALRDIENYLDFFDYIFGRSSIAPENRLYYDYSFKKWKRLSGEHINPLTFPKANGSSWKNFSDPNSFAAKQDSLRKKIHWLLGKEPLEVPNDQPFSPLLDGNKDYTDDYLTEVIGQIHFDKNSGIKVMRIGPYHSLGTDNLWGAMFFPAGSVVNDSVVKKLPLVIYLHKYSFSTGYHNRNSAEAIQHFLKAGYAVLAFDFTGFGTRIEEALHFYNRYPQWSKMGMMVSDTRGIIGDAYNRMPFIDSSKIFLVGYSLGGTVALLTAALDNRVKGVAVVCAFSSFRNDNKGTEGIRHFYELHGLLPRLGFFQGHEQRIPIDFDGILSCIAPRKLLVIAPQYDRDHSINSVNNIMSVVDVVYKDFQATNQLTLKEPKTYNHFTDKIQQQVADWLKEKGSNDPPQ